MNLRFRLDVSMLTDPQPEKEATHLGFTLIAGEYIRDMSLSSFLIGGELPRFSALCKSFSLKGEVASSGFAPGIYAYGMARIVVDREKPEGPFSILIESSNIDDLLILHRKMRTGDMKNVIQTEAWCPKK